MVLRGEREMPAENKQATYPGVHGVLDPPATR
jgi:hypothetical protein